MGILQIADLVMGCLILNSGPQFFTFNVALVNWGFLKHSEIETTKGVGIIGNMKIIQQLKIGKRKI